MLGCWKGTLWLSRRVTLSCPCVSVSPWVLAGKGVPQPPPSPARYERWGMKEPQPPCCARLIAVSLLPHLWCLQK